MKREIKRFTDLFDESIEGLGCSNKSSEGASYYGDEANATSNSDDSWDEEICLGGKALEERKTSSSAC